MMRRDVLRPLGFLAAFGSALIHLAIAPEHMAEVAYIGWLFIIGGLLLGAAAWGIAWHDSPIGWRWGAVLCAGMVVGLLLSRTTGLPGGYREGWEPEAWWSLALEMEFLGCYVARLTLARGKPGKEVQA